LSHLSNSISQVCHRNLDFRYPPREDFQGGMDPGVLPRHDDFGGGDVLDGVEDEADTSRKLESSGRLRSADAALAGLIYEETVGVVNSDRAQVALLARPAPPNPTCLLAEVNFSRLREALSPAQGDSGALRK
jgi:hypothetical protein